MQQFFYMPTISPPNPRKPAQTLAFAHKTSRKFGLSNAKLDALTRQCAFQVARGFQSLFNQNEAAMAVQIEYPRGGAFWRQTLEYCVDGNVQAVLDEQLHLEATALELYDGTVEEKLCRAATSVFEA